jgi:hypothetical protein
VSGEVGLRPAPTRDSATGLRASITGFVARHEVAWELGMVGLAVLFVAVGFAHHDATGSGLVALETLDVALTGIFATKFGSRFLASPAGARTPGATHTASSPARIVTCPCTKAALARDRTSCVAQPFGYGSARWQQVHEQ